MLRASACSKHMHAQSICMLKSLSASVLDARGMFAWRSKRHLDAVHRTLSVRHEHFKENIV